MILTPAYQLKQGRRREHNRIAHSVPTSLSYFKQSIYMTMPMMLIIIIIIIITTIIIITIIIIIIAIFILLLL